MCVAYENSRSCPLPPGPNLKHQERLNGLLQEAVRCISLSRRTNPRGSGKIAPLAITSIGPADLDRKGAKLRFRKRAPASYHWAEARNASCRVFFSLIIFFTRTSCDTPPTSSSSPRSVRLSSFRRRGRDRPGRSAASEVGSEP